MLLSNIELYYSPPQNVSGDSIRIMGEESSHISKVMRHIPGDELFITNGIGDIFKTRVESISKDVVECKPEMKYSYQDNLSNFIFCIPRLKSHERMEFALEKCTELGIKSFLIFESKRTIAKGSKLERWNKIVLSAMKQSLRSYLPKVNYIKSLKEIMNLEGDKILFEQEAGVKFDRSNISINKNCFFVFGPEGGFEKEESDLFNKENIFYLSENRLRTETAVIKCASLL